MRPCRNNTPFSIAVVSVVVMAMVVVVVVVCHVIRWSSRERELFVHLEVN